ncbi:hypothetical protein [Neisseria viridiae]|uniref:hypothetical protein n=1 Tax=Neisseria viridiae TaxID=2830648 RepID=UPI00265A46C0|nr:hypothetical protein [Neisseria viridiae]
MKTVVAKCRRAVRRSDGIGHRRAPFLPARFRRHPAIGGSAYPDGQSRYRAAIWTGAPRAAESARVRLCRRRTQFAFMAQIRFKTHQGGRGKSSPPRYVKYRLSLIIASEILFRRHQNTRQSA